MSDSMNRSANARRCDCAWSGWNNGKMSKRGNEDTDMGMDLRGTGGTLHLGVHTWRKLLHLAQMNGWQPAGTQAPDIWPELKDMWNGSYFDNAYQAVTDEDALAIAKALEGALDDIPDYAPASNQVVQMPDELTEAELEAGAEELARAFMEAISSPSTKRTVDIVGSNDPFGYFAGDGKRTVQEFIAYCKQGGFLIG